MHNTMASDRSHQTNFAGLQMWWKFPCSRTIVDNGRLMFCSRAPTRDSFRFIIICGGGCSGGIMVACFENILSGFASDIDCRALPLGETNLLVTSSQLNWIRAPSR